MRIRPFPFLRGACVLAALSTGACRDMFGDHTVGSPGEAVGTYQVTATIDPTSTCSTLRAQAAAGWTFQVTLRSEGSTAYWTAQNFGRSTTDRPAEAPVAGQRLSDGSFSFVSTQTFALTGATGSGGTSGAEDFNSLMQQIGAAPAQPAVCNVVRSDRFTGRTQGGEAGVDALSGTLTFDYSAAAGSDCGPYVGPVTAARPNPQWGELPCSATFTVAGTRTGG